MQNTYFFLPNIELCDCLLTLELIADNNSTNQWQNWTENDPMLPYFYSCQPPKSFCNFSVMSLNQFIMLYSWPVQIKSKKQQQQQNKRPKRLHLHGWENTNNKTVLFSFEIRKFQLSPMNTMQSQTQHCVHDLVHVFNAPKKMQCYLKTLFPV